MHFCHDTLRQNIRLMMCSPSEEYKMHIEAYCDIYHTDFHFVIIFPVKTALLNSVGVVY